MTVYERRVRWYQAPLYTHVTSVQDCRAIEIAHRRWGKDEIVLAATNERMHKRPGTYWHCLPQYGQARKAIWEAVNAHTGRRRIDEAFPPETRKRTLNDEMFIELNCGSTWQCIGSDRYNATVGAGPVMINYSEWALCNPSAWAYHRPMLEENGGGAVFITTPRGKNHAHQTFQHYSEMAGKNPRYYAELSSIQHTGALTAEQLAETLAEYQSIYGADMGQAQYDQEYMCSFNAAILGAFYARECLAVRNEGRIDPNLEAIEGQPVHTAWDIGVKDDTSIWWFQVVGSQIYVLDCYSSNGAGVEHYAEVKRKKAAEHGWLGGNDYVPHDARVKEWGTGKTRVETMRELGLNPVVVPMMGKLDGIQAARTTLARSVFHTRCEAEGIAALEQYRREWDDDKKTFKANEVHDWSSHLCFTGETKVLTRHGMQRIDNLPQNGEVFTKCGWTQYHSPRVTRNNAQLVAVEFTDGLTVRCTPDHLFLTESGWISAQRLETGMPIQSSLTPSPNTSTADYTASTPASLITRAAAKGFTETHGLTRSVKSQAGAIFTTRTKTRATISYRTLSAFLLRIIGRTLGPLGLSEAKSSWVSLMRRGKRLLTGIGRKRAAYGTSAMPSGRSHGPSGSESRAPASTAGLSSSASFEKMGSSTNIAGLTAKPLIIASVRPLKESEDVWCLTVPESSSFSLENGAIVHNCDAFRYLSVAWRSERPVTLPNSQRLIIPSQTIADGFIAQPLRMQRR